MSSTTSAKRLNIDRRMVGILSLFTLLGIALLIMVVLTTNSLSAMASYGTLQVHWVEARKAAAFQLIEYIETGDKDNLAAFQESMDYIENASIVRKELEKQDTNEELVRNHLLKLGVLPDEIYGMISTFEFFQDFAHFEKAINNWARADDLIFTYYGISEKVTEENISDAVSANLVDQVLTTDDAIATIRDNLTTTLTTSTLLLKKLILWVSVSLGVLLIISTLILSFRFLRSIKQWYHELNVSKQRYESLFEQNPNAVFSMSEDGQILEGNTSFSNIFTGKESKYPITNFSDLFTESGEEEAEKKLQKVKEGTPLSFELQWKKGKQEIMYLQNTIMPIIVDGEVEGMFGIAEDVTFAKKAEAQIREQLEEKTVLLAEIHHRVKNNLAIISGLLELQQGSLQEASALRALSEAKTRIKSIAMIHEKIYQNESLANINFRNYVEELATMISGSFDLNNKDISLHVEAENVDINLDQSIPCGLILNELICNAYEHAFKGKEEGNIWVSFSQINSKVKLNITDDGIGLPDEWEARQFKSLGLTLVQTLSKQLEGSCSISNNGKTQFEIIFDKKNKAKGHLD